MSRNQSEEKNIGLPLNSEIVTKNEEFEVDVKEEQRMDDVRSNTLNESDDIDESEPEMVITQLDPAELYADPIYAELCSYFNVFSILLGLKPISFAKLDKLFCTLYNSDGKTFFCMLHRILST